MAAATTPTHPHQVAHVHAHAHAHAHAARCEGDREPWPVARRAIRRGEGPRDEKDSPSGGACNRGPTPPLVLVLLTLVGGCAGGCSAAARPLLPWLLTALHWPLTATNHRVLPRGGPPAVWLFACLSGLAVWPLPLASESRASASDSLTSASLTYRLWPSPSSSLSACLPACRLPARTAHPRHWPSASAAASARPSPRLRPLPVLPPVLSTLRPRLLVRAGEPGPPTWGAHLHPT
jgi:hypothetical protein